MKPSELKNAKPMGADIKVRTVILNFGFAEEHYYGSLILTHNLGGFGDIRTALCNLQEILWESFTEAVHEGRWATYSDLTGEEQKDDFEAYLMEMMLKTNDGTPGGYESWEQVEGSGWDWPGKIQGGILVEIQESAEKVLRDKANLDYWLEEWDKHGDGTIQAYVTTVAKLT